MVVPESQLLGHGLMALAPSIPEHHAKIFLQVPRGFEGLQWRESTVVDSGAGERFVDKRASNYSCSLDTEEIREAGEERKAARRPRSPADRNLRKFAIFTHFDFAVLVMWRCNGGRISLLFL